MLDVPFSEEELISAAGSLPVASSVESQLTSRCLAPAVAAVAVVVAVEVEVEATAILPAARQSSLPAAAADLPELRSWR